MPNPAGGVLMPMTISEALAALEQESRNIGHFYPLIAERLDPAIAVIRSRLEVSDEMVTRAARIICHRHAVSCNVDEENAWDIYSDEFRAEAFDILKNTLEQPKAALVAALGE